MTCQCEPELESASGAAPTLARTAVPAWVPTVAGLVLIVLGWALGGLAGTLLMAPVVVYAAWLLLADRAAGRPAVMFRLAVTTLLAAMMLVQLRR